MPSNSPEYQRTYRNLRKNERKEEISMLLKIQVEIENLRKDDVRILSSNMLEIKGELAFLRKNVENIREQISPTRVTLSSSSESKETLNLKKEERKIRESALSHRARLDAWMPSVQHDELAAKRGHNGAWLNRQAELYRLHQVNAKTKHKVFDAGFTSWILRAETFEGKPNGHAKKSPVEKLYEGAYRAALAWEERERARLALDEPLLDC